MSGDPFFLQEGSKGKRRAVEEEEESSDDPWDNETPVDKRRRIAHTYLQELHKEEEDEEQISHRLSADAAYVSGRSFKGVVDTLPSEEELLKRGRVLRGHQRSVTCTSISTDGTILYSGSKDCSIIRYDVETGKRTGKWRGMRIIRKGGRGNKITHKKKKKNKKGGGGVSIHTGEVLALALSEDGRYLASGGQDALVHIWDMRQDHIIRSFSMHRQSVTALGFERGGHVVYSGSIDGSVNAWNVDTMSYVETLFGHTQGVTSLDTSFSKTRILSAGEDRALRLWKIPEEKNLVLEGHSASIDCACFLSGNTFLSGSQDGSLALWTANRDKPVVQMHNAHTIQSSGDAEGSSSSSGSGVTGSRSNIGNSSSDGGSWVCSVGSCLGTDIAASGGMDGVLRLWKANVRGGGRPSLDCVRSLPVQGVVNSIVFSQGARLMAAGIGKEHKYGRWFRMHSARNSVLVLPLI